RIDRRLPRGAVPRGEAENVHRGGGRYISIIGSNDLFHNTGDRGPEAVDLATIERFAGAFAAVATTLVRLSKDGVLFGLAAGNSGRHPPPCGEGLGVGVVQWHATAIQESGRGVGLSDTGSFVRYWQRCPRQHRWVLEDIHGVLTTTPTPNPSPQGGGE